MKGLSLPRPSGRPGVPWWVSVFTDVGRPLAAVVVLGLCAPGEAHLAQLAGFGMLSWGMAGLFSMYAGIAAVVATVRPSRSPGKKSAVAGAIISLLFAMGAQPVSHLFVTGWVSAEPRPPVWLVVSVSCVPPFILGHLLHLAASPVRPAEERYEGGGVLTPAVRPQLHSVPSRPKPPVVRPLSAGTRLSGRAHELAREGQDKDAIKETLRNEFPDAKPDSIRKAAERAVDKVSAATNDDQGERA